MPQLVGICITCSIFMSTHCLMVARTFLFRVFMSDSITSVGISFLSMGSYKSLTINKTLDHCQTITTIFEVYSILCIDLLFHTIGISLTCARMDKPL